MGVLVLMVVVSVVVIGPIGMWSLRLNPRSRNFTLDMIVVIVLLVLEVKGLAHNTLTLALVLVAVWRSSWRGARVPIGSTLG